VRPRASAAERLEEGQPIDGRSALQDGDLLERERAQQHPRAVEDLSVRGIEPDHTVIHRGTPLAERGGERPGERAHGHAPEHAGACGGVGLAGGEDAGVPRAARKIGPAKASPPAAQAGAHARAQLGPHAIATAVEDDGEAPGEGAAADDLAQRAQLDQALIVRAGVRGAEQHPAPLLAVPGEGEQAGAGLGAGEPLREPAHAREQRGRAAIADGGGRRLGPEIAGPERRRGEDADPLWSEAPANALAEPGARVLDRAGDVARPRGAPLRAIEGAVVFDSNEQGIVVGNHQSLRECTGVRARWRRYELPRRPTMSRVSQPARDTARAPPAAEISATW
jgi:hypothetical protein